MPARENGPSGDEKENRGAVGEESPNSFPACPMERNQARKSGSAKGRLRRLGAEKPAEHQATTPQDCEGSGERAESANDRRSIVVCKRSYRAIPRRISDSTETWSNSTKFDFVTVITPRIGE